MIDYENQVGIFGLSGIKENSVRSKIIDLFGNFLHINNHKNYNIIATKSKMMFNQNDSYPFYKLIFVLLSSIFL